MDITSVFNAYAVSNSSIAGAKRIVPFGGISEGPRAVEEKPKKKGIIDIFERVGPKEPLLYNKAGEEERSVGTERISRHAGLDRDDSVLFQIQEAVRDVGGETLSSDEKHRVEVFKRRDAEVRAHEAAHMTSGGGLIVESARYEYEIGPDGRKYAIGGEVSIDVTRGGTPEETIGKMKKVSAAALAPESPSMRDREIAAMASTMAAVAKEELARQRPMSVGGGVEGPGRSPAFVVEIDGVDPLNSSRIAGRSAPACDDGRLSLHV